MWNKTRLSTATLLLLLLIGFISGSLILNVGPVLATSYLSDNFEAFTTGWTTGTGGTGTVTKSSTQAHGGSYSAKHYSIGSADQAYAYRSLVSTTTGNHHYSIWLYLEVYTSFDHMTVIELYNSVTSKLTIYASVKYHDSAYYVQNYNYATSTWVDVCSVSVTTWFQLEGYYAYTTGKIHYYLNGVKQGGDFNSYSGASATVNTAYQGDLSTTAGVQNGYAYFDDLLCDDSAEPLQYPAVVSGSPGSNSTLTVRGWLFYTQWYMPAGELSGYIFSYNASGSMANDTWVAFAQNNNSWANVSKTISNNVGVVIQWIVYANGSTNLWTPSATFTNTTTAELTCFFTTGGSVRVNSTNMGNGTALTYSLTSSIANLGALSNNASYGFLNFTWSDGISGSSTTNSYNLTITNCTTVWTYFYFNEEPGTWITACFTWSPGNPESGEEITFDAGSSTSSGAIANYTWQFNSGEEWQVETVDNVLHTYYGNQTVLVSLIVGGDAGNSTTFSLDLVIGWGANHTCVAQFTYAIARFEFSPSNPGNTTVMLFNGSQSYSSGSITDFSWDFGDGNVTSSGAQNWIEHAYGVDGLYNVILTVGSTLAGTEELEVNCTGTTSDGYIFSGDYSFPDDYEDARGSSGATIFNETSSVLIENGMGGGIYAVMRGYFIFDTSALLGGTVLSAEILLNGDSESWKGFNVTFQNGQPSYPHDPLIMADFPYESYSGGSGDWNTTGWLEDLYFAIPLNSTGLSWIDTSGGNTRLCMRHLDDIRDIAPTRIEYLSVHSGETGTPPILSVIATWPVEIEATNTSAMIFHLVNVTSPAGAVSPGGGGSFGWGAIVLILLIPSLIVVLVLIRRRR